MENFSDWLSHRDENLFSELAYEYELALNLEAAGLLTRMGSWWKGIPEENTKVSIGNRKAIVLKMNGDNTATVKYLDDGQEDTVPQKNLKRFGIGNALDAVRRGATLGVLGMNMMNAGNLVDKIPNQTVQNTLNTAGQTLRNIKTGTEIFTTGLSPSTVNRFHGDQPSSKHSGVPMEDLPLTLQGRREEEDYENITLPQQTLMQGKKYATRKLIDRSYHQGR